MPRPTQNLLTFISMALAGCALSPGQEVTLAPNTALRIQLDHRVRIRVGASVAGHLTEPVYLVDHEVIPSGSLAFGMIRSTHPGTRALHVRRLLAGDFTPPRVADVVFDTIFLPMMGGEKVRVIRIDAPAVVTDASVLTLGTKKQKFSIKAHVRGIFVKGKQTAKDDLKHPQIGEAVEKWALGQLPYHPEILWSKTLFNADLATVVTVPDVTHPLIPVEDLRGQLPEGVLHARLLLPLSSETAKRGDPVEAIITEPLLSVDRSRLLVPQGTHLHGVVMQAKAARSFGRNGDLRFAFRNLDLPTGSGVSQPLEIHGRLSAAETSPGQHVTMDEEGQTKASDGPAKYAEPLLLGVLALAATPDHDGGDSGAVLGRATVSSNGFGLIARGISLATRNTSVIQGFAYFALAKSMYFHFIDKGHDTTFPRDTEIQVTLSER